MTLRQGSRLGLTLLVILLLPMLACSQIVSPSTGKPLTPLEQTKLTLYTEKDTVVGAMAAAYRLKKDGSLPDAQYQQIVTLYNNYRVTHNKAVDLVMIAEPLAKSGQPWDSAAVQRAKEAAIAATRLFIEAAVQLKLVK